MKWLNTSLLSRAFSLGVQPLVLHTINIKQVTRVQNRHVLSILLSSSSHLDLDPSILQLYLSSSATLAKALLYPFPNIRLCLGKIQVFSLILEPRIRSVSGKKKKSSLSYTNFYLYESPALKSPSSLLL